MRPSLWIPAGLLALLVAAVALGGSPAAPGVLWLQLAAGALAGIAALWPGLRAAPPAAAATAALWIALALAQTAWAADRDAALDGAAGLLAAVAVFLVSLAAVRSEARRAGVALFAAFGAVVGALAILRAEPGVRAAFPLGNPNHLAAWLLLPGGIAFTGLFLAAPGQRPGRRDLAWFAALALIAAGMAASGSRGGALAGAAAALGAWRLRRHASRPAAARALAALGAAGLLLALLPPLWPALIPAEGAGGQRSAGLRWLVYGASARTALAAAPLGVGLGGFAPAFTAQRPADLPYVPRSAHNELLHGAVELGLPFALALAASAALIVAARRRAPGPAGAALVTRGGAVSLLALGVHSLIDFAPHVPAIALAAAWLGGLAWSGASLPARRTGATRACLALTAVSLLALAGSGWVARAAEERSQRCLAAGDFAGAERAAREGLRLRPGRVALLRGVAEAAVLAAELDGGGPGAAQRGLEARVAAAQASPLRADLQVELFTALWNAGERRRARAAFERAAELDPAAPGIHLSRARLLLASQRPAAAAESVRAALVRHPLATHEAVGALLRVTGDPALARAAVPETPHALAAAGRVLAGAGYARDAADSFERALALDPDDARIALETARSLRAVGEPERAGAVVAEALARRPGDPRLRRELEQLGAALARASHGARRPGSPT